MSKTAEIDYAELIEMHEEAARAAALHAGGDKAMLFYGERSAATARALTSLLKERARLISDLAEAKKRLEELGDF